MNFEDLIKKCKECHKCRLRKNATQVVPGAGNPKAEIMFRGEAPGASEDREGVPFCGAAGNLLDELLESVGINRKDVFITNIVKCRPPGNREPQDDEIKTCRSWTNALIKIIEPKVFVLLGRFALNKFFPDLKISQVHGKSYKKWGRIFFIMYHPAVALYNNNQKEVLLQDIKGISKILNGDLDVIQILDKPKNEIISLMKRKQSEKKNKEKQLKILI
jgi:DNA polymerase